MPEVPTIAKSKVPATDILPFPKFAEKFFFSLATNGINELKQADSTPGPSGLGALCHKAYKFYVWTIEKWQEQNAK